MRASDGFAVNYYGPLQTRLTLPDGLPVTLRQDTRYPLDGAVKIQVQTKEPREFTLRLRIPAWSAKTVVRVASANQSPARKKSNTEDTRDPSPDDDLDAAVGEAAIGLDRAPSRAATWCCVGAGRPATSSSCSSTCLCGTNRGAARWRDA